MKQKYVFYIYTIVIFALALWGANAWFFMGLPFNISLIIRIVAFLVVLVYQRVYKVNIRFTDKTFIASLFFVIAAILAGQITRFESVLSFFVTYYPVLILICDVRNADITLRYIRNYFAILLVPSIFLHLIFTITSYPPTVLLEIDSNSLYTFLNYGLLVKNIIMEADNIRFSSIFIEPGYLGTFCAFLLYASKFDFKEKSVKIILIALILSFSLAGYVAAIISWIFLQYAKRESMRKYLLYFIAFLFVYLVSVNFNNGDNLANKYIYSRLETDKDKGIKGNNRNSELTDFYFEQMCKDGSILYGKGVEAVTKINGGGANDGEFTNQIRGAGYKYYCVINGCFAAFLYLGFYYLIALRGTKSQKRYNKLFFCLVLLIFLQASYPTSYSWLIPFILGTRTFELISKDGNRNIDISRCA